MKILFIIIILFISVNSVYAQLQGQAKIDSLLKELPKMKKDTNGVNLLTNLSYEYFSINPDEGIRFGEIGAQLSQKLKWKKGLAVSYKNIGVNYRTGKSEYKIALGYFEKALKISKEIKNKLGIANNYGNLGELYKDKGDYAKSLEYLNKANKIFKEINDKLRIGLTIVFKSNLNEYQSNYPEALKNLQIALKIYEKLENQVFIAFTKEHIGNIYFKQFNYELALKLYNEALKLYLLNGNNIYIANIYGNIGAVYKENLNFTKSLEFYHKSLNIYQKLGNKLGVSKIKMEIGDLYTDLNDFEKSIKFLTESLILNLEVGNLRQVTLNYDLISESFLANANLNISKERIILAKKHFRKSLEFSLKSKVMADSIGLEEIKYKIYKKISVCYENLSQIQLAFNYHKLYVQSKDSIYSIKNNNKLIALEQNRKRDLNKLKLEKQSIQIEFFQKEKENQTLQRHAMFGGIAGLGIIIGLILIQRRKSEKLLLNVLPAKIAKRLKKKEINIADDFEIATTVFIDLVGFTSFAKDRKASEVVKLLNNIFHRFDDLVKKHGLEKIKTMGDGYLAVSGVPEPDKDHCQKAVNFALDVKNEIEKFNQENGLNINARIGLESGPLVAGVIGSSKFIYDIWGDSVNTASRMESTGLPGKIQITENVKVELEKQSLNFTFEKRDAFEVKGKGIMNTYFLEN